MDMSQDGVGVVVGGGHGGGGGGILSLYHVMLMLLLMKHMLLLLLVLLIPLNNFMHPRERCIDSTNVVVGMLLEGTSSRGGGWRWRYDE